MLRSWAVQDSPPGAAVAALVARVDELPADWLSDAALIYNARTATAVVPAAEVAWYGAAQLPFDEAGLRAVAGPALDEHDGDPFEAVALAVDAVASALDGRSLSRDDLHEELRQALPASLLPWCEGCGSHHARRGLLVLAGLHGKLCIAGRAGRQPLFARTDQRFGWDPPDDPGPELVRRYHAQYGASSRQSFQAWSGLGTAHAKALWFEAEGAPATLPGLALLAPGDPILLTRDREALVPDAAMRKRLWSAIPNTGLVTVDGEAAALWKARKQGRRLEVTVEGEVDRDAVLDRARALAPHRGAAEVVLT